MSRQVPFCGKRAVAAAEAELACGTTCMQVLGVAAVHDREARVEADVAPWTRSRRAATAWNVPPQTRLATSRAESACPPRREDAADAAEHLGGGAAREREQQDAPRVGAALR